MKQLKGRTAVITGAASGIGRALGVELAKKGCHLALADLNEEGLAETARLARSAGARTSTHRIDVAKKSEMQRLVDEVLAAHQGVHIVINNAGVSVTSSFADHTLDDFEWLMGINFWGVVYGCKLFLPHLLAADEGHIVNLSSVFGLIGVPMQSSYCASKFAVRGLSETLRAELADTRVGVTSVHPGGIATNIASSARFNDKTMKLRDNAVRAFSKMLPPEEAARQIVRGIERRSARVLITREALFIDWAKRFAPVLSSELTGWGFHNMERFRT